MSEEVFPSGTGDGEHPDQHFCECGEAWFEGGLLAFEISGEVNGYSGWLRCIGCGAPHTPFTSENTD